MTPRVLLAALLSAGLCVPAANALTVVNTDNVTHRLLYKPNGGAMRPLVLKSHQSKNISCYQGCALTVGKTNSLFSETTDKVWIKNSKFVRG